jgi:hypothetical protein
MDVVIGIDDFRHCKTLLKENSKWITWRESYYTKYATVFDMFLKYMYKADLETWQTHIENLNFDDALAIAEKFLHDEGVKRVTNLLLDARTELPISSDFVVYLLIGLGHIDGTAMPANPPFLYFGLERYISLENLEYLVPHEYNHLVRMTSLYEIGSEPPEITLGDTVISEGLATVFSALFLRDDINLARTLQMTDVNLGQCHQQRQRLFQEIFDLWNEPITPSTYGTVMKYLMANGNTTEMPERSGYYVGNQIIQSLVMKNHNIADLTKMPTTEILRLYKSKNVG